jgi:mono/diheme cytochrome c family protein
MVEAHEKRRRIPIWAMPMLAALPLWAYVFAGTLEPPPSGEGPAELGAALFASNGCGACHGATGGGGVGPAFTNGAIYQTWPRFEDQVEWVRLGSTGWIDQHGDTYGATNKPVNGGMPSFGSLSDEQLVMVVYHERNTLGGPNPNPADAERLELAAELLLQNPDATLEEILAQVDSTLGTE